MKKLGIAVIVGATAVATAVSFGAGTASAMTVCGSANGWNVGVVGAATCGFAFNVARGVNPSYPSTRATSVDAFSPATGLSYSLTCQDARQQSGYAVAYECDLLTAAGGIVYLWQ